jgi:hypothetical protein
MVTALHKCGHYVIDLKPSNVSVYKDNMLVAMVDCDGFSIQGDKTRYPAEFVSEEYICPESIQKEQSCAEMGENQDRFALAVIIFRLLNNGIHPFSGMPKDPSMPMLTIQERIKEYHYAYGLWPDTYQYPHPYSIHEYFNKDTLELFERAFTKDDDRPSAYEWQEHLWKLMHGLKQCKNDPNHVYFTSKGCGLCSVENKFHKNFDTIKKQKSTPATIRGFEISQLSTEKVQEEKELKQALQLKLQRIFYGLCLAYILFFALLYKAVLPFKEELKTLGLGIQLLAVFSFLYGLKHLIKHYAGTFSELKNSIVGNMLLVYAFIWLLITLVMANDLPRNLFSLAP